MFVVVYAEIRVQRLDPGPPAASSTVDAGGTNRFRATSFGMADSATKIGMCIAMPLLDQLSTILGYAPCSTDRSGRKSGGHMVSGMGKG